MVIQCSANARVVITIFSHICFFAGYSVQLYLAYFASVQAQLNDPITRSYTFEKVKKIAAFTPYLLVELIFVFKKRCTPWVRRRH